MRSTNILTYLLCCINLSVYQRMDYYPLVSDTRITVFPPSSAGWSHLFSYKLWRLAEL